MMDQHLGQRAACGQPHAEERAVVVHAHGALPIYQRQRGQPAPDSKIADMHACLRAPISCKPASTTNACRLPEHRIELHVSGTTPTYLLPPRAE